MIYQKCDICGKKIKGLYLPTSITISFGVDLCDKCYMEFRKKTEQILEEMIRKNEDNGKIRNLNVWIGGKEMEDIIYVMFYLIIIIGCWSLILGGTIISYMNTEEQVILVTDKYVKGEQGRYFVIDENGNAYIVKDLIFKGKFNSTDIYNQIKIGEKYKIETTGYRIRFLSQYKNINKVQKIENSSQ